MFHSFGIVIFFFIACVPPAPGNLEDLCNRRPSSSSVKSNGDNGFRIRLEGERSKTNMYTPEQIYTVSITGTLSNQRFMAFMLVAAPHYATDETTSLGIFQHFSDGLTQFVPRCPYIITNTDRHLKTGIEVLWTAPAAGAGCVEFRATVIENEDSWFKDDGALIKTVCEDTGISEQSKSQEMTPDCCACGAGKYQMTFHSIWSRQTHPKSWPENQNLIHWSNIVGASHSKQYIPWQYGEYASSGIKKVCEFGFSPELEEEMRKQSRHVRTVIKTPGIWWNTDEALKQTRWARFSVDRKNHLLSMLTMVGPSPDWCVGISGLDLCLPNCTWSGDLMIDLYPWDAGTDDGIQYEGPDRPSDPPQKIRRLTNNYPDNPMSPFYGPTMYRPFAKLEIKRLNAKPDDTINSCSGEDEESDYDDYEEANEVTDPFHDMDRDMILQKLTMLSKDPNLLTKDEMIMKQKLEMALQQRNKCMMSEWSDWLPCSVTCGVGQRLRKRAYKNPMMTEDMCGEPTMQKEKCMGAQQLCEDINSECSVTAWSSWTPCSVTCGKGMTERLRYYLHPGKAKKRCERTMNQKQMCTADIPDCTKAAMMTNFTALCSSPMHVGHCHGSFNRWYFNVESMKCEKFVYSGCRGNENQFRSYEKCTQECYDHMRKVLQVDEHPPKNGPDHSSGDNKENDCAVSDWSKWSTCSSPCGNASFKVKRRRVLQLPKDGGKPCPRRLERRKKCNVPKCNAHDCQLTQWSRWSSCGMTCGEDSVQERMRQIITPQKHGGRPCGPRLQRKICLLPPCET